MFCAQCGAKLPNDAKFCSACGERVRIAHDRTDDGAQRQDAKPIRERPVSTRASSAPAAKRCPSCGLPNRPTETACRCGYRFIQDRPLTSITSTKAPDSAPQVKSSRWSLKVEDVFAARAAIRECAMVFYLAAAMQLLLVFLISPFSLVDVIAFAGVGAWLQFRPGRVVGTIAAILGLSSIVMTALNQLGLGEGGKNVVVAIITGYASLRAAVAVYKYSPLALQVDRNTPNSHRTLDADSTHV